VGYDDSRLARATWARLTTIGQDSAAIARAAVERAIARIIGEPADKSVLIKPTLIERATTAPPQDFGESLSSPMTAMGWRARRCSTCLLTGRWEWCAAGRS
jgi:hypothetical protein